MINKIYNYSSILIILSVAGFMLGLETPSLLVQLANGSFEPSFGKLSIIEHCFIAASNSVGAIFGCLLCGFFYDFFGVIKSIQTSCVFWMGGCMISVFMVNSQMLMVGRLLKGLSIGFLSSVIPMYIMEIMPCKGKYISIIQWSSNLGSLCMFGVSYGCVYFKLSSKFLWSIESVPSLILLVGSFFIPESPTWLYSRSKWSEAKSIIDSFVLSNESVSFNLHSKSLEKGLISYGHLFNKRLLKHTMVSAICLLTSQLAGVVCVSHFFLYTCELVGIQDHTKLIFCLTQYGVMVVFTLIPVFLLDQVKRKDCLVFGMFILFLCYGVIGGTIGIYGTKNPNYSHEDLWYNGSNYIIRGEPSSLVLGMVLFIMAVSCCFVNSCSWLYSIEIFPSYSRSKGCFLNMGVFWMVGSTLLMVMPILLRYIGYFVFVFFGGMCLFNTVLLGFLLKETKGLADENLETVFRNNEEKRNKRQPLNISPVHLDLKLSSDVIEEKKDNTISDSSATKVDDSGEMTDLKMKSMDVLAGGASSKGYSYQEGGYLSFPMKPAPLLFARESMSVSDKTGELERMREENPRGSSDPIRREVTSLASSMSKESEVLEVEGELLEYYTTESPDNTKTPSPIPKLEPPRRELSKKITYNGYGSYDSPTESVDSNFFVKNPNGSPLRGGLSYEPTGFFMNENVSSSSIGRNREIDEKNVVKGVNPFQRW